MNNHWPLSWQYVVISLGKSDVFDKINSNVYSGHLTKTTCLTFSFQ